MSTQVTCSVFRQFVLLIAFASMALFTACGDSGSTDTPEDGDITDQDIMGDAEPDTDENGDAEPELEDGDHEICVSPLVCPTEVDFGNVILSQQACRDISIMNSWNKEITITKVEVFGNSDEFTVLDGPCGNGNPLDAVQFSDTTIDAGESTMFGVQYIPADPGPDEVRLVVTTRDDPCDNSHSITLISRCKGECQLTATPGLVDFGNLAADVEPQPQSVVLANECLSADDNVTLKIGDIRPEGSPKFSLNNCMSGDIPVQLLGLLLPPGEDVTCEVGFQGAMRSNVFDGSFTISTTPQQCQESRSTTVQTHAVVDSPMPVFMPSNNVVSFCYSGVGTTPPETRSLILKNNGTVAFTLQSVAVDPANAPFYITSGTTEDITLEPDEELTFGIAFEPQYESAFAASLLFTFDFRSAPYAVTLLGRSVEVCPDGFVSEGCDCIPSRCYPADRVVCDPEDPDHRDRLTCNSTTGLYSVPATPCPEGQVCVDGPPPFGSAECRACEFEGQIECFGNQPRICRNFQFEDLPSCNDAVACTTDSCDPTEPTGCAHVPVDSLCDDTNDCTEDVCDPSSQVADKCVHTDKADDTVCDDGLFCIVDTTCQSGRCVGETRDCNADPDYAGCKTQVCNEALGQCTETQTNLPNGTPCDDGDEGTTEDQCTDGLCAGTPPASCSPDDGICCISGQPVNEGQACADDGNDCTDDICSAIGICIHPSKDDGIACGSEDQCLNGNCVDCTDVSGCGDLADDGLECSEQVCNLETNTCEHDLTAHSGELCADDNLTCTRDLCDDQGQCSHDALEDNSCLIEGTCYQTGEAQDVDYCVICDPAVNITAWTNTDGTECAVSDDNNPCTDNVCQQGSCAYVNNDANACEDSLDCTATACQGGSCVVSGVTAGCLIDGACVDEGVTRAATGDGSCRICNAAIATDAWTVLENGESCDDGDGNSFGEVCTTGGVCLGCTPDCNGKECGDDGCGGSCGECGENSICSDSNQCIGFMVNIPPGNFSMGSPQNELGHPSPPEEELHNVILTHPFAIMAHEVTQKEWREIAIIEGWGFAPSHYSACGDNCPVECVNWFEAAAYANAKSRKDGLQECYVISNCIEAIGSGCNTEYFVCSVQLNGVDNVYDCEGYRLPTEAEWEYAIRANSQTAFYQSEDNDGTISDISCADSNLESIGWYCGNSNEKTHPIALKTPNTRGIYDGLGNVYEWVWDWYGGYTSSSQTDPVGPTSGSYRIHRGGAYYLQAQWNRCASRSASSPLTRGEALGFRLARSLPCIPNCDGKECGDDGCGGSCGECGQNEICGEDNQCHNTGITWVDIPEGVFQMGCSPNDSLCHSTEFPNKIIYISSFQMSQTEITQDQYELVMGHNPSWNSGCSNCPVDSVSKLDAKAFCENIGARLPSESEWEYAARAGTTTMLPCNGCSLSDIAWYGESFPDGNAHPVAQKSPNNFGLYDMIGNVHEFVEDCRDWNSGLENTPIDGSSYIDENCPFSCTRGGSWASASIQLRSSFRTHISHDSGHYVHGFRCARDTCIPNCENKECGSDGCGGSCSPGCQENEYCTPEGLCQNETPQEIVLKDGVVILDDAVAATVDSPVCGTMQFPLGGGLPPFEVVAGNAIVSGYQGGFLCTVNAVSQTATHLVLETTQGSLDDVIAEGSLAFSVPVEIGSEQNRKGTSVSLGLSPITLLDTGYSSVTLRPGALTFQPSFDVEASWGPIAGTYFKAVANGSITADMGIDVNIHETWELNGSAHIYDHSFPFYFQAGGLPVTGTVRVEIIPGFTATAQADLTSSFGATAYRSISAGAEYYDSQWHAININSQSGYDIYGPDIDGAVNLSSEVRLDVKMTLNLYKAASAYILAAPRVEGDVSANTYLQYNWDLNACIWAGYGGDITIFHRTLASYHDTLFNRCWDIWDGSGCFNACSPENLICTDAHTVEGCGEAGDGDNCLEYTSYTCEEGLVCDAGACVPPVTDLCTSGVCCDTTADPNVFKPSSTICETEAVFEYGCPWGTGCGSDTAVHYKDRYCSGESMDCNGNLSASWTDWQMFDDCLMSEKCNPAGYCEPCCDNTCPQVGDRQCVSDTTYSTCGDYNSDGCVEWSSSPESCGAGNICDGGQCYPCGDQGEYCCANSTCNGTLECVSGTCIQNQPACGSEGEECCQDDYCESNLVCNAGMCTSATSIYSQDFEGSGFSFTVTCSGECTWTDGSAYQHAGAVHLEDEQAKALGYSSSNAWGYYWKGEGGDRLLGFYPAGGINGNKTHALKMWVYNPSASSITLTAYKLSQRIDFSVPSGWSFQQVTLPNEGYAMSKIFVTLNNVPNSDGNSGVDLKIDNVEVLEY